MANDQYQAEACIMCQHFKAIVPPGWKATEDWKNYGRYDVLQLIRKTKLHQKGLCALEPVHREVPTNHFCGHYIRIEWGIWETNLARFIWGSHQIQEIERLESKVEKLKRQLKAARERSHKRLLQLQSNKSG